MRILNLLEGSEKLFHFTDFDKLRFIIQSGAILCSAMELSEVYKVKRKLHINGKIFYLSLARSPYSMFIQSALSSSAHSNFILFEVDGRKLSRYGRVLPFHFFSTVSHDNDEMEDRLIGDRGRIPLDSGVFTGIRILADRSNSYLHMLVDDLSKFGIPIRLYDTRNKFLNGRGGESIEEFFNVDKDASPAELNKFYTSDDAEKFMKILLSYVKGNKITSEEADFVTQIFRTRFSNFTHLDAKRLMIKHYDVMREFFIVCRRLGMRMENLEHFVGTIERYITMDRNLDGASFVEDITK